MTDDEYFLAVMEHIEERCEVMTELLVSLRDLPDELDRIKEMLIRLEQDHDWFYQAMRETRH